MDSRARSIAKAVSYRLAGSATTGLLVFLFGGHKLALSAGAGAVDMVLKIGLYFLHERLWNQIDYGRAKRPEYEVRAAITTSTRMASSATCRRRTAISRAGRAFTNCS